MSKSIKYGWGGAREGAGRPRGGGSANDKPSKPLATPPRDHGRTPGQAPKIDNWTSKPKPSGYREVPSTVNPGKPRSGVSPRQLFPFGRKPGGTPRRLQDFKPKK